MASADFLLDPNFALASFLAAELAAQFSSPEAERTRLRLEALIESLGPKAVDAVEFGIFREEVSAASTPAIDWYLGFLHSRRDDFLAASNLRRLSRAWDAPSLSTRIQLIRTIFYIERRTGVKFGESNSRRLALRLRETTDLNREDFFLPARVLASEYIAAPGPEALSSIESGRTAALFLFRLCYVEDWPEWGESIQSRLLELFSTLDPDERDRIRMFLSR